MPCLSTKCLFHGQIIKIKYFCTILNEYYNLFLISYFYYIKKKMMRNVLICKIKMSFAIVLNVNYK